MVALGTQSANLVQLADLLVRKVGEIIRPAGGPRRRMQRLSDEQIAGLAAERAAGSEIDDLAMRYGIHRATVITHLHRVGVPGGRRQGRMLSPDLLPAAGEMYACGASLVEVGERFDVDRRYLRRALSQAGFPLRPPGRQRRPKHRG